MKQWIVSFLFISCLFSILGCANTQDSSGQSTSTETKTEEAIKSPPLTKEGKSDVPLSVLQANSHYQFQLKDNHNEPYDIHIYSPKEDSSFSDYQLYVSDALATYGVLQDHLTFFEGDDALRFRDRQEIAYVSSHQTGRDLLVLSQKEKSNQFELQIFALEGGILQEVTVDGDQLRTINGELRNIGNRYYQTVEYSSDNETGWFFTTWELDEDTLTLSLKSQSVYNEETFADGVQYGQEMYERWRDKPTSTFAYPSIPVTSDWLAEVEKGRFPSVSFAIGTRLQEIFDQEGEPDAITDWLNGAETFIFNNIGYAVTASSESTVNTLLIPGALIDGDVELLYETLGEPDEQVDGDTEVVIYNTGTYTLYIEKNKNEIETILVSKTETPEISADWSGTYTIPEESGVFGELNIYNEDETGFEFDIHVSTTHVGEMEGYAQKDGNTALQIEDEIGCQMTFVKEDHRVTTTEGPECWGWSGMAIDFNHTFVKKRH
ncbi:hypothetical protein [Halalkalibacter okhensis]|uniref:Lipoprotein n=1 Tax=Halalkalibacter okhensis TaxID=333138 RepID=A0A0B0IG88_9BACI|nr:hypothetical protein [Halalkalibacter okhensis]KHF38691.1 hypothetical protein LQ50_19640 [Halalkalibacter okhensis]